VSNNPTTPQNNAPITGYSTSSNAYTYFRIFTQLTFGTRFSISSVQSDGFLAFGIVPFFTPATSSVSLALDNAVPNQLNVGGAMSVAGGLYRQNIPYLFRVQTAAQTILNSTSTVVLFDTIQRSGLDVGLSYSGGTFTNITNNTIYYNISSNIGFGGNNTSGARELYVLHSSLGIVNFMVVAAANYSVQSITVNAIFPLSPGENFVFKAFQNSGTSLNTQSESVYYARVTITCLNM
jgi:hypothetical protein